MQHTGCTGFRIAWFWFVAGACVLLCFGGFGGGLFSVRWVGGFRSAC